MKAFWIGMANLRRMFRARTNIFFVFVFPMVLILVLGATFGGSSSPRLGVVTTGSGPLGTALLRELEQTPHLRVVTVSDPATLLTQVERGNLAAGVVIPPGYDGAIRAGHDPVLRYLARPDQSSQQLGETVRGAVARQAALLGAARFAVAQHAAPDFSTGLATATRLSSAVPAVSVTQTAAGTVGESLVAAARPVLKSGAACCATANRAAPSSVAWRATAPRTVSPSCWEDWSGRAR